MIFVFYLKNNLNEKEDNMFFDSIINYYDTDKTKIKTIYFIDEKIRLNGLYMQFFPNNLCAFRYLFHPQ